MANILCVHLVLVVLTQKMALPVGGGIQIAFAMVFQYVVFAMFLLMGVLRVHLMRSLLLLAFVGFATIVHAIYNGDNGFSPGSLFLLILILAMYSFVVPIDEENYNRILKTFQKIAVVASLLVFVNWGTQIAGLGIFNLEDYIPDSFQYINYVYMNKLKWNLPWIKPNGIVFLEVSHLSQFIGMALVIELARFRRLKFAALYAVALLSSFGGTGTLLVMASPRPSCSPSFLANTRWRSCSPPRYSSWLPRRSACSAILPSAPPSSARKRAAATTVSCCPP